MTFVSFCSLYFHRSKFYKKIVPSTWPTIYLHIYIYIHIFIYTLSTRLSIYRYKNEYINREGYEQIHIFVDELLSTNIPIYSCMFLFREGKLLFLSVLELHAYCSIGDSIYLVITQFISLNI